MSSKPESTFIRAVHKHLGTGVHAEKMANPYRGGTPDCWYSGPGSDLWIEYKFIPRVPAAGVLANLSELQSHWLRERFKEGRNVAVIIGSKDGGVLLHKLHWENIISHTVFVSGLKSRAELAAWISNEVGVRSSVKGARGT